MSHELTDTWVRIAAVGALALLGVGAFAAAPAGTPASQPSVVDLLPQLTTAPVKSGGSGVIPVPYRPWMPPARSALEPRMVPADRQHALRARPALDLPPTADSPSPSVALPPPAIAVAPAIQIFAPSAAVLGDGPLTGQAAAALPRIDTDPTIKLVPPGALVLTPPPRKAPAPVLLLSIPDPSRQAGGVPVTQIPVLDPPVPGLDRPPLPVLPVPVPVPPVKK